MNILGQVELGKATLIRYAIIAIFRTFIFKFAVLFSIFSDRFYI